MTGICRQFGNPLSSAPVERALLVDLDATPEVAVVAAACRVRDTKTASDRIEFTTDGIDQSNGLICIKIPTAPKSVSMDSKPLAADSYEFRNGLLASQSMQRAPKEPK